MLARGAITALLIVALAAPAAAQEKQPPYWASIASGQAMTHTGPGRNYPNVWLYQRRDLPVRVVKKYENWRLIQDPDGAQGWMLVTMLSDRRTAIVKPGQPRPVRVGAYDGAKPQYMAEPGVAFGFVNLGSGNVALPGRYLRSQDEPACWMNDSTHAEICAR